MAIRNNRRRRKTVLTSLIASAAVGTTFMVAAAPAMATPQYTQVVPGGLSMSSATATARVQQLLDTDAGVREAIASNYSGLTAEELDGARVVSAAKSTSVLGVTDNNSARAVSTGSIVPTSYMSGKKVFTWTMTIKLRSGKTVVQKFKWDCSNPLLRKGSRPPALRMVRNVKAFAVKFAKSKTTKRVVVCPSGQSVTVTVKTTVRGRVKVKSITQAAKLQSQRLSAQVSLDVTNRISVVCAQQPPVVTPPPLAPPPVVQQVIICGNGVQNVGNGNSGAIVGDNCNTVVLPPPPVTPPPPPPPPPPVTPPPPPPPVVKTVRITSMTTLNDIPTGKTSGPFYITVNASHSGGSVTVDPGIGAVSKCDSTTPTGSVTFSSLPAGNSQLCIIVYAPNDPGSRPTSMTVTVSASLGNANDVKSSTFAITYPVRPE